MATIGKSTPRSYEEFQPSFEWIQDEGSEILRIPLPGFNKDKYIKVQMDNLGNLRVSGERPLGAAGNRWSRFRMDFRVPENCNARDIRANFEDDVLDVVLPRLVARPRQQSQPAAPPQAPAPISPPRRQPIPSPPRRQPIPSPPRRTMPSVGDDQDHTIRNRKESTLSTNIGATPPPKGKPVVDPIAAAQAKEKTGEPGQLPMAGLGKNLQAMVPPEKDVESANKLGDAAPRRRKEPAAAEDAATGGVKEEGGAAGKPKELGASLSFNKPNQLLLNVGVAIGVLVGLTSYLAYNLGKSVGTECRCH